MVSAFFYFKPSINRSLKVKLYKVIVSGSLYKIILLLVDIKSVLLEI